MSIDVFRYRPEHVEAIEPGLAAYDLQKGGTCRNEHFEQLLADPEARHDAVFAALDGDGKLALGFVPQRPIFQGNGRLLMYLLPQEDEAAALSMGKALFGESMKFLACRGISRSANTLLEGQEVLRRLAVETGHEVLMPFHNLRWEGDGTPLELPHVDGVDFEIYRGGDPDTNSQIEAVWNRAFRTEPLSPGLSPDWLERSVKSLGIWYLIARDSSSGKVVGLSEAGPGNFFSGIAVARSHWGTSLADALVLRTNNEFMARGHNTLHSMTRITNAPSLKLQARLGWKIVGNGEIWATPDTSRPAG